MEAAAPIERSSSDAGLAPDASTVDSARDGAAPAARFDCTLVLGFNVTGDWFDAGFERLVDGDRWQVKGVHDAMIEAWANPAHAVWRESGCDGAFSPCATRSRCAGNAPPDRVLFVTQSDRLRASSATTQAAWESAIKSAMDTIRSKYPTVRRIELMTFPRSPESRMCGGHANIPPHHDAAHAALAAASNGAVTAAPRFRVMDCNQFGSFPPYMTAAGYRYMAELIGKHYGAEK
jgi:hypothetical protein